MEILSFKLKMDGTYFMYDEMNHWRIVMIFLVVEDDEEMITMG